MTETYTFKTIVSRPTHLGRKPRTAAELLRQTHKYLVEEGKWIKGAMFKDGDAKKAYEKGFCNNWGACSVGALGIVAGDFTPAVNKVERLVGGVYWDYWDDEERTEFWWQDEFDDQSDVVVEACGYLLLIIDPQEIADALSYGWGDLHPDDVDAVSQVIDWNDAKTTRRSKVLDTFAKAADLAARPGSFDKVARKYLAENGFLDDLDTNDD